MACVAGRVTDRLEALVTLRLVPGSVVESLVDTGASCALVLPQLLIDQLGLPIVGYEDDLGLVGDERTSAYPALAQIEWLGEVRFVEVTVHEDLIIGTELLDGTLLTIDYSARTLAISRKEVEP